MTVQEEMKQLVIELNEATEAYDKGHPIMTDADWDEKYFRLVELESQSGFSFSDSPTRNIHFVTVSKLNKVEHNHKMLSLDKTKEIEEVKSFLGTHPFIAMDKMDGLTCSLKYLNGVLVSAETRGNGIIGEDILHNAKIIPSIPNIIDNPNFTEKELIIDGEIICSYEDFANFSNEYKNPRNFASGSIRLLSSKECAERKLQFVAWDVIKGFEEKTLHGKLQHLKALGFTTVPYVESGSIEDMIEELKAKAQELSYPIDGVVFKFDDIEYGKTLGETSHHFRNALAYKFYDEEYETKLLDIEWSMGRTGVLTPVAIFEPIEIDGVIVERASLHNVSVMRETLGLYPDLYQPVFVYKANQIIPQISRASYVNNTLHDHVINNNGMNMFCPICGQLTEIKNNDGVKTLWCVNPSCEGKLVNHLNHFCGKKGLDIKGLSKATLEKLIDWGWVTNFRDILMLKDHAAEWKKKDGFGDKSVEKILNAIVDATKDTELYKIISAADINLIGLTAAKDLAKHFKTWGDFRRAVEDDYDFTTLPNFGEGMSYSILHFDFTEIDDAVVYGIHCQEYVEEITSNSLDGITFVITGKLTSFKNRDELKSIIESKGGKVAGAVSQKTNYLINNDNTSTSAKNVSAQKLGIPIITEAEFKKIFDI